jgi:choline kinase
MDKKKKLSAIILIAGSGNRISSYSKQPKCLLKIKGKTILERNLDFLEQTGFKSVKLVVGFKFKSIENEVKKYHKKLKINFIYNKRYKTHGNCYSLYLSLLKTDSNILFIDGDLFYEKKILSNFTNDKNLNSILVGKGYEDDVECAKVFGEKKYVRRIIEKRILKNKKYKFIGEALGINKLDKKSIKIFINIAKKAFKSKKNLLLNWDTFFDLFLLKRLKLSYSFTRNKNWIEIDTYDDFKMAKKIKLT